MPASPTSTKSGASPEHWNNTDKCCIFLFQVFKKLEQPGTNNIFVRSKNIFVRVCNKTAARWTCAPIGADVPKNNSRELFSEYSATMLLGNLGVDDWLSNDGPFWSIASAGGNWNQPSVAHQDVDGV